MIWDPRARGAFLVRTGLTAVTIGLWLGALSPSGALAAGQEADPSQPAPSALSSASSPPSTAMEEADFPSFEERWQRYLRTLELPTHRRGGQVEPRWLEDGTSFVYPEGPPHRQRFLRVRLERDAEGRWVARRPQPLFDRPRLGRALEGFTGPGVNELLEAIELGRPLPIPKLTVETLDGRDSVTFEAVGQRFRLYFDDYSLSRLPTPIHQHQEPQLVRTGLADGDPDVYELPSPDGRQLLNEGDGNLWRRSVADSAHRAVTTTGTSEDGFQVDSSLWSPDGLRLLTVRGDKRGLRDIPVIRWLDSWEVIDEVPYTRSGGLMEHFRPYLIDVLATREREITWDRQQRADGSWDAPDPAADAYYFPVDYSDAQRALLMRVSRTVDRIDLLAVDPVSARATVLLTETSPTFIEGLRLWEVWQDLWTPLQDGGFLWLSDRDGWRHVYRYSAEGQLLGRLTAGGSQGPDGKGSDGKHFEVQKIIAVDEESGTVFLTANAEAGRPYDTHLYRVPLRVPPKGSPPPLTRLSVGEGEHEVTLSPSHQVFLDRRSAPDQPPTVTLRSALDGRTLALLSRAEVDLPPAWDVPEPEPFQALADDGVTELHGWLFFPPDFDPQRRYPVLDYIYNGPFITWAPQRHFDRRAVQAASVAQMGYIVAVLDGRGTPERGKAFQDVVYRSFGQHEVADHAAALRGAGATRPWMDLDRVGIYGGSWGGYMTQRALLTEGDLFTVGVSTAPVADLWDHNMIIEAYMDLPSENIEGYRAASNIELVSQLKGELMLIHGTSDINAPFSSTMKLVDALVRAGIEHRLVILPNQTHWFDEAGDTFADRARLGHFDEFLRPEYRPAVER
ncbi:MAG: prolyl oligopeptidase family serine peptidase [Acidobacteriota bacterium]